ncbi:MAG: septation protein IspZ [Pseudomonadota bacterium]
MAEGRISAGLKTSLELGPLLIFFIVYFIGLNAEVELFGRVYGGFIFATLVFIPVVLMSILSLWALSGKLSGMQIITGLLVVVLGGLDVLLNQSIYFKIKPTLLYLLLSAILVFGLWRKKSYIQTILGDAIPMYLEGWMILTRRIILFFCVLGLLNEVIWRNFETDFWVSFKTFGLPALTLGFLALQMSLIQRYEDETRTSKD